MSAQKKDKNPFPKILARESIGRTMAGSDLIDPETVATYRRAIDQSSLSLSIPYLLDMSRIGDKTSP